MGIIPEIAFNKVDLPALVPDQGHELGQSHLIRCNAHLDTEPAGIPELIAGAGRWKNC